MKRLFLLIATLSVGFLPFTYAASDMNVTGNLKVIGRTKVDSLKDTNLAGVGTRMVVAGPDGGFSTQAIPGGGSAANPTAQVGTSAVNGAATTYMRSDAAPPINLGMIPTWTGIHTWSDTTRFNGVMRVTSPAAGSIPFTIRAAGSQTADLLSAQNSSSTALVRVTNLGDVLIDRSDLTDPVTLDINNQTSGSAIGARVRVIAGTGDSKVQWWAVASQLWSMGLDYSDSRALVISSDDALGTNNRFRLTTSGDLTIPSGIVTASGGFVPSGGTSAAGTIIRSATGGLLWRGFTGSSYDFSLVNVGGTTLLANPTGGSDVRFPTLSGADTRMVTVDADGDIGSQAIPSGGGSGANPSASVGTTTVNGAASTFMRSDAAPPINQALVPTWTGRHTFDNGLNIPLADTLFFTSAGYLYGDNADGGSITATPQFFIVANDLEVQEDLAVDGATQLDGILTVQGATDLQANTLVSGGYFRVTGGDAQVARSQSGGVVNFRLANYSNTANSDATLRIMGNGSSGGDQSLYFMRDTAVVGGSSQAYGMGRIANGDFRMVNQDEDLDESYMFQYHRTGPWYWHFYEAFRLEGNFLINGGSARYMQSDVPIYHVGTFCAPTTSSEGSTITIPIDSTGNDFYAITLTGDVTITTTGTGKAGRHFTLRLKQDGTGGRDVTFDTEFEFPDGTPPTPASTTAGTWSYYSFVYNEDENTVDFIGNAFNFGP